MGTKTTGTTPTRAAALAACALAAMLAFAALSGCSSTGSSAGSGSDNVTRITKTLVKTASNDLVLSGLELNPEDSPITISSDDPAYAEFIDGLKSHSGLDIERVTMQVDVVASTGAVLGAGSNDSTNYVYTVESLDAVADSHDISYTEKEGFK